MEDPTIQSEAASKLAKNSDSEIKPAIGVDKHPFHDAMNPDDDGEDDDEDSWADANDDQQQSPITKSLVNDIDPSTNSDCDTSRPDFGDLSLHRAVFDDDVCKISEIINNESLAKQLINKKDMHGNTPLHLACMRGSSQEVVEKLLKCGASIDSKNLNRWTPFHEACSYGNREIMTLITKRLQSDIHEAIHKNKFLEKLEKTKNYRMVLKWEFQSWVPLLTRVLPSDVCVISKQGKQVRIDTRLLDFELFSWKQRGDCCLIYSNRYQKKWIIMNNKLKKYQYFETHNMDKDIEVKVDEIMSSDIMDLELKSTDIQFTRSTCGWIWKADKIERIGKYNASHYTFTNVFLVMRKRREHLSEKDLKRNKMAYKGAVHLLKFGKRPNMRDLEDPSSDVSDTEEVDEPGDTNEEAPRVHRESLPPPPKRVVSWQAYCQSDPGNFPTLGREHKVKVVKTPFKASIAMSDEFPITKNDFIELLSVVPLKLFKKLKEFIEIRLPDGFPIRLEIPIFPFLTARITFEDFAFIDEPVDELMFSIPDDYEEDPNLFPMLAGKARNS